MTDGNGSTTDVSYYVGIVRSRKWQVLLVTLLVILAAGFWTFRQTPVYFAQARVQVFAQPNLLASGSAPVQQPNMDTELSVVGSRAVVHLVQIATHPVLASQTLLHHLRTSSVPNANVLLIGYTSTDKGQAASMANIWARAYTSLRNGQFGTRLDDVIAANRSLSTKSQLELAQAISDFAAATTDKLRNVYQSRINLLNATLLQLDTQWLNLVSAKDSPGASILQTANVPTGPASPKKVRDLSLAAIVGLLLGLGVAFGLESLDNRVKSRDEFEQRLGAPVLAVVPRVRSWRRNTEAHLITVEDPRGAVSEAYRTLGTNVRYAAARRALKVITITSAMSGEGKTTTAANLALVLAQSGRRVILVSADLRRPRVHEFFHVSNGPGLSEALAGTAGLGDLIVDPGVPGLRLLNSGSAPDDPVALLAGDQASRVFDTMRDVADFVVIDAPPILAVADASILSALSDATIFVMDGHVSGRSALDESRDQLDNAGASLLGGVYNTVDERSGAGYYRYSKYARYYGSYYGDRKDGAGAQSSNGSSNGSGSVKRPAAERTARR